MKTSRRSFFAMLAAAVAAPAFLEAAAEPVAVPDWRTSSEMVLARPTPRQAEMMDRAHYKLYGGARGGGKSWMCDPRYAAEMRSIMDGTHPILRSVHRSEAQ